MFFTCSPPSLKSGSTSDRMHKVRLAPLIRAGQYLCTERGVLPHPERGVVPHPERGSTSAPSEVYYHTLSGVYYRTLSGVYYRTLSGVYYHTLSEVYYRTLSGGYITLRVEGTLHPERGVFAHSFGWDIHTKVGLQKQRCTD